MLICGASVRRLPMLQSLLCQRRRSAASWTSGRVQMAARRRSPWLLLEHAAHSDRGVRIRAAAVRLVGAVLQGSVSTDDDSMTWVTAGQHDRNSWRTSWLTTQRPWLWPRTSGPTWPIRHIHELHSQLRRKRLDTNNTSLVDSAAGRATYADGHRRAFGECRRAVQYRPQDLSLHAQRCGQRQGRRSSQQLEWRDLCCT